VEHRVEVVVEVVAALERRVVRELPVVLLAVEVHPEVLLAVLFVGRLVVDLPGEALLVLVPLAVGDAAVGVENKLNVMTMMHISKHSVELVILAMDMMIS
jgi:hypothetical protein